MTIATRNETVPAGASGGVYTVSRQLGATSTLSLATGTNANLSLSGTNIIAATTIGPGVVQKAIVAEQLGDLIVSYPVIITGKSAGVPLPGLTPGPIAVLLTIGDSNPRGASADQSTVADPANARLVTWNGTSLVPYQPGVRTGCTVPNTLAGSEGRVGMELGFATSYLAANPGGQIAIVKYARAGSFQTYSSSAPVSGDASNSWDPTSGSLLTGALAQLSAAMAKLRSDGFTPALVAVIEGTGTNDATDATAAGAVQTTKTAMYAAIRAHADFAAGTTAFLTVRQHAASSQTNIAVVRAAQAAVANLSADALLIDTDGQPTNSGDTTHFTAAGLLAIGGICHATRFDPINDRIVLPLQAKLRLLFRPGQGASLVQAAGTASAITDLVGNRTLSATAAGYQPAVSALAGATALDFDGSDDELTRAGSHGLGTGDAEGFLIVSSDRPAATTNGGAIYQRGGNTDGSDLRVGRTVVGGVSRVRLRVGVGGSSAYQVVDNQVSLEGGPFVIQWRLVGTAMFISVNGQAEQTANLVGSAAIADSVLAIGGRTLGQQFDGKVSLIGEVVVLTSAERAAATTALLAAAGL